MFELCLLIVAALAHLPQAVKGLVGGEPARDCSYHALMKKNGDFFCNGALITTRHVLTDASCADFEIRSGEVTATVGIDKNHLAGSIYHIVENLIYTSMGSNLVRSAPEINFNLAIYTLQSSVSCSVAMPVNIQPPPMLDVIGKGASVSSTGQPEVLTSSTVHRLSVMIISLKQCYKKAEKFNMVLDTYNICALSPEGTGLTQWDNGGPLVQNHQLIGIAAITPIPIDKGNPSVYISVHHYKRWIMHITDSL